MACGKRVDGEQTEGWLAVDEHHVVVAAHLAQHAGQDLFAGDLVDQVHFCGRQVDVGRDDVQAGRGGVLDGVGRVRHRSEQQVVNVGNVVGRNTESGGEGALRVEVDCQHPAAVVGESRAQADGCGGLANPTLLVAEGDDACRTVGF